MPELGPPGPAVGGRARPVPPDLTMPAIPAEVGAGMDRRVPFTGFGPRAGLIDAVGLASIRPGLGEGSAVAVSSPSSCGACRWCRRGGERLPPRAGRARLLAGDGSLAAYVLVWTIRRALVALGDVDPSPPLLTDAGRHVAPRGPAGDRPRRPGRHGGGDRRVAPARSSRRSCGPSTTARIGGGAQPGARRARALQLGADEVVDGGSPGTWSGRCADRRAGVRRGDRPRGHRRHDRRRGVGVPPPAGALPPSGRAGTPHQARGSTCCPVTAVSHLQARPRRPEVVVPPPAPVRCGSRSSGGRPGLTGQQA